MTRVPRAVSLLAALGWAAGLAVSPAAAQLSKPAPGFEPGQPYVLTVQGERGTPLMVVHVGRIPLDERSRVELLLPDLGDSGLVYALSTRRGPIDERDPPSDPSRSVLKKPQWVVGRVHTVVILSPVNPALGRDAGTHLSLGANGMDYWLVPGASSDDGIQECVFGGYQLPDSGAPATGSDGVLGVAPDLSSHGMSGSIQGLPHGGGPPGGGPPPDGDELFGSERRPLRPVVPGDGFPGTGPAMPGHVDGVLIGGERVTGVDPGGSGPQELATETCSFGGYQLPFMGEPDRKRVVLGFGPGRRLSYGMVHSSLDSKGTK